MDASVLDTAGARSARRDVNGVRLHAVTAGDEGAPLVVLLHGFPDATHWVQHERPEDVADLIEEHVQAP